LDAFVLEDVPLELDVPLEELELRVWVFGAGEVVGAGEVEGVAAGGVEEADVEADDVGAGVVVEPLPGVADCPPPVWADVAVRFTPP
jgi:hypothetical protein